MGWVDTPWLCLQRRAQTGVGERAYSFWVIFTQNKRKLLNQTLPSSKVAPDVPLHEGLPAVPAVSPEEDYEHD